MVPLFRAVVVWTILLASIILPRLDTPANANGSVAVTQLSAYDALAEHFPVLHRALDEQEAQIAAWAKELQQGMAAYQAELKVMAAAKAEADRYAALSNHAPPPPYIAKIINDAFSPLGPRAVQWAINVAYCESRYHPNSVNTDSGATGLFQFMAGTWSGTPWASKPRTDPVANAQAAAWLYSHYGPGRWTCQG